MARFTTRQSRDSAKDEKGTSEQWNFDYYSFIQKYM